MGCGCHFAHGKVEVRCTPSSGNFIVVQTTATPRHQHDAPAVPTSIGVHSLATLLVLSKLATSKPYALHGFTRAVALVELLEKEMEKEMKEQPLQQPAATQRAEPPAEQICARRRRQRRASLPGVVRTALLGQQARSRIHCIYPQSADRGFGPGHASILVQRLGLAFWCNGCTNRAGIMSDTSTKFRRYNYNVHCNPTNPLDAVLFRIRV